MPAPRPSEPTPDGGRPDGPPEREGLEEVIAEAEALRELLHTAASRCSRLLAALKQQRRQGRAVRAAVAALRQLRLDP